MMIRRKGRNRIRVPSMQLGGKESVLLPRHLLSRRDLLSPQSYAAPMSPEAPRLVLLS